MAKGAINIEGTIHVDRYLTDFSVGFIQDARNFVSTRAASRIPVTNQSNKYVVYDRGYFWRDEAAPRPLGGRPRQVGYKIGEGNYNAVEYALEHIIDDRQRNNVDAPIRLEENATRLLTQKQLIKQDRVWAQQMFGTGKWSFDVAGIASTPGAGQFLQFSDANSDPIQTIDLYKDSMMQATGFRPNTLVLGAAVKRKLRVHPDISDRIKYTQVGIADEDVLGALFEVPNVVVARGVYNAAEEGDTNNFQFIVPENAMWLGYIDPNPGLDSPTAIAMFTWTGLVPGATNEAGGVIERGRDERAHSDWFQNRMAWDIKQVAADLGVYFSNVLASGSYD